MPISAALLPEFDQEMTTTRKVLERVGNDIFAYKPHEKSFSSTQLASHIVDMIGWLEPTIAYPEFNMNPPGGQPYQPWIAKDNAELMGKFEENRTAARAALEKASDAEMMANWSLKSGDQTFFTMPRIACIRGMIINHIIHHRGQLSVYLRLNEIPVPAMYGPSADEGNM